MMYHALVRINGVWVSFGLHIPSDQWTNVFHSLQRAYGAENVAHPFWAFDERLDDVYALHAKATSDIRLANEVQRQWDAGGLRDASDGGNFNVSRGIRLLRLTAA
jgi:hypothetical protein